ARALAVENYRIVPKERHSGHRDLTGEILAANQHSHRRKGLPFVSTDHCCQSVPRPSPVDFLRLPMVIDQKQIASRRNAPQGRNCSWSRNARIRRLTPSRALILGVALIVPARVSTDQHEQPPVLQLDDSRFFSHKAHIGVAATIPEPPQPPVPCSNRDAVGPLPGPSIIITVKR